MYLAFKKDFEKKMMYMMLFFQWVILVSARCVTPDKIQVQSIEPPKTEYSYLKVYGGIGLLYLANFILVGIIVHFKYKYKKKPE